MRTGMSDKSGPETVWFGEKLAGSQAFADLFRDGMALVEEVAAYLDGPGRDEAKQLPRSIALAYAAESMRLTTRLMQLASWLLVQRAVNAGEMTQAQAAAEKHKVRLCVQEIASGPNLYSQLPSRFQELTERSLRLQARLLHLDRSIQETSEPESEVLEPVFPTELGLQREKLRLAFHAGP